MERGAPADGSGPELDWGEWIPRLIRFYGGGDVETWLRTPLRWLRCCVAMYGRLQAEENLNGVAIAGAGNPLADQKVRQRMVDAWQAQLPRPAPQRRQLTPEEYAGYMRALGMEAGDGSGQRQ